jgi:hypothetical protein
MMKFASALVNSLKMTGLAVAVLLTACGDVVRTSPPYISAFYSRGLVSYVTQDRAMPLEVVGQPFAGLDASDIAWHVAQRMKLPAWFAVRDFAPAPVEGTPSGNYRTVLVFNNADLTTDSDDLCRSMDKIETNLPGDQIIVIAAFCAGDEVVTDTYGAAPANSPDSEEYHQLLWQISMTLFPFHNIETEIDFDHLRERLERLR